MMCCYYPTTTVAIDDDADFLLLLTQHLGIKDCAYFSSPNTAIVSLKDQNPYERIQSRIIKKACMATENISSCPEDYAVIMNMRGLHEEIYNQNRFHDVSVIIVDYYMGELNGIDVCEALASHPAKKILLTGGLDKEKVAINAFNKGIIHRFINKSDQNFPEKLRQSLSLLKDAYFRDLSSGLMQHIPSTNIAILQNPTYINFINNLKAQFHSIEYYLLDVSGSTLFLDINGTPVWFIVKNDSEIQDYAKIAEDQDANKELIKYLSEGKNIPFFFSESDYQCPPTEWRTFLYQAHPLPGIPKHNYTIQRGNIRNNLINEDIVSYQVYQNNKSYYELQV